MEEKELIQLSKEGVEDAFAALVEKYRIKVFNLAFSFTRDRETADDLAQEVFIKTYFALPKFKFKSEFGTWLYRITLNHVKDYLRKMRRLREVPFDDSAFSKEGEILVNEKEQEEEHKKRILYKLINELPEKYRTILTLRDIQGTSYAEISKILKLSPGTVDSRLFRARKMLQEKAMPFLRREGGRHEM